MNPKQKTPLFEKGFWVKEQQGVLTMGSLDKSNKETMVIPDALCERIQAVENEMMDALYGESREMFQPEILDMDLLFKKLGEKFEGIQFEISFKDSDNKPFKGRFNPMFSLLRALVESSASGTNVPVIHIKASIVEGHLCIVYQDEGSVSDPSKLTPEFYLAKNKTNGTVQFQKKKGNKEAYYDIMIPSTDHKRQA